MSMIVFRANSILNENLQNIWFKFRLIAGAAKFPMCSASTMCETEHRMTWQRRTAIRQFEWCWNRMKIKFSMYYRYRPECRTVPLIQSIIHQTQPHWWREYKHWDEKKIAPETRKKCVCLCANICVFMFVTDWLCVCVLCTGSELDADSPLFTQFFFSMQCKENSAEWWINRIRHTKKSMCGAVPRVPHRSNNV